MSKNLKMAFLAVLLIGASYFFGTVCQQIGHAYELLLLPSRKLLTLLLWFLMALGAVAVTGGLVAALVRPVWLGIIAFALSGLTMLLGWQVTVGGGVLVLVYLIVASLYEVDVARELNQRIRFSVRPIGNAQSLLLNVLVCVACGSLYLGYATHIEREGFSIPEPLIEILVEQMEKPMLALMPEKSRQEPELETHLAEWREGVRRNVEELFERTVKPHEELVPLAVAIGLFMLLVTVTRLLAWVPTTVLSVVFLLLTPLGITEVISETQEVHRLVID